MSRDKNCSCVQSYACAAQDIEERNTINNRDGSSLKVLSKESVYETKVSFCVHAYMRACMRVCACVLACLHCDKLCVRTGV
jgi:hypothetical protein